MAGIAARVRRRGGWVVSGFAVELREGCGLFALASEADGESGGAGDAAVLDFKGSYSEYNLSSSSLASGTIVPWSIRVSRYCEARYAMS